MIFLSVNNSETDKMTMTKKFLPIFFLTVLFFAAPVSGVDREESAVGEITGLLGEAGASSGLGSRDIRLTVSSAISYALSLLGVIFLVLIVYAGFLWMTAGGEEDKIGKARKLIFNGVIGMFIILGALTINVFIFRALVRSISADPLYEPLGYQCDITWPTVSCPRSEVPR